MALTEVTDRVHGAPLSTRGAGRDSARATPREIRRDWEHNGGRARQRNKTTPGVSEWNCWHQIGQIKQFLYPWSPHAILVMCSDGIHTRWDVNPYQGLVDRDPSLIAATLYRDFARGRDDTTVLVFKMAEARG